MHQLDDLAWIIKNQKVESRSLKVENAKEPLSETEIDAKLLEVQEMMQLIEVKLAARQD
jgi:hypothetical protein